MAGGLPLAKWQSNSPSTLKMVTEEEMIPSPISFDDCPTSTKLLGLLWYPQEDYFSFKINSSSSGSVELWLQKLSWDEPLSSQLTERWCNIREDLKSLINVRAPRWILLTNEHSTEVHNSHCPPSDNNIGSLEEEPQ
ncbi:uncharacterized protein LOC123309632 [Coccinella septempunctata]|uniref:uncharacterized protein LOC123309632 n=1 Tax=Coccinella septempunctata TaxID=41139 RepID=UPI001D064DC4|nr:uncharacterized protein LOC123309632 [Coccinella septempunctata]